MQGTSFLLCAQKNLEPLTCTFSTILIGLVRVLHDNWTEMVDCLERGVVPSMITISGFEAAIQYNLVATRR